MENLLCPACEISLTRLITARGVIWRCEKCDGRAVGLALLRGTFTPESINPIWLHAIHHEGRIGRACPSCRRSMIDVPLKGETSPGVEVCQLCQMIWFDAGEVNSLEPRPLPPHEPSVPQEVREAIAIAKVKALAERARESESGAPDELWKQIAGYIGMPVPCDDAEPQRFPLATVALAFAISAISIFAFKDLDRIVKDFGLIPAEAMRLHGLTFVTSFFLHGSVLHLIGNIYFLLVFGPNVEDSLGAWRYLGMVGAAALLGDFAHMAMNPTSTIPIIGASGGISGAITFYAFAFPQQRIAFAWRFFWWIRLPAWFALVVWIGFQLFGAYQQHLGHNAVSSIAHLGGALAGVAGWLMWRKDLSPRPPEDRL